MLKFLLFLSSFVFVAFLYGSEFYIHKYTNEALDIKNRADNYIVVTGTARQLLQKKQRQYAACIKKYSQHHDACKKVDVSFFEQRFKTTEAQSKNEQERYLFLQGKANTYTSIQRLGCSTSMMAFLLFLYLMYKKGARKA